MDTSSQVHISFEELNAIFGSIDDVYAALAQKYYLPKKTSKAINKPYLQQIFFAKTNILKVPNTITRNYIEYQGTTILEMMEKLERFLEAENHPPLGMDKLHTPDYQWLYDTCIWIDPTNKMGIKRHHNNIETGGLTRLIDEE